MTVRRDRPGVERRLVDAVGELVVEGGLAALGVNAVAARAGVDKVLVYRYFGGLDGLIERWARSPGFWPSVDEVLDGVDRAASPGRVVRQVLARYRAALQARPATLALLAWETAADHPGLRVLEDYREAWSLELRDALGLAGDAAVVGALMGAAAQYLLVRSRRVSVYNGLALDDAGWERLLDVVQRAVDGVAADG